MKLRFWIEGPGSFLLAIGLALMVRWAFVEAYMIPSGSMMPTLLSHDHIFVNKFIYGVRWPFSDKWLATWGSPHRGDVIVFRRQSKAGDFYLKRVIGVPGDRIYVDGSNIYVNERLVEKRPPTAKEMESLSLDVLAKGEYSAWIQTLGDKSFSILYKKNAPALPPIGPIEVPYDHYFVIGDHRDSSDDSRTWESDRFIARSAIMGRASLIWLSCDETLPAIPFLCNPLKVRWSRILQVIR